MAIHKECKSCGEKKELGEFSKDRTRPDGYHPWCRECKNTRQEPLSSEERVKQAVYRAEWKKKNKDKVIVHQKTQYDRKKQRPKKPLTPEQIERRREVGRNCYHANKEKPENKEYIRQLRSIRKRRVRTAMPRTLSKAHQREIIQIYKQCRTMNEKCGNISYHVDHIEPLIGETSCGLHTPWNLRIIPARENLSKGNKLTQTLN
jgi:ribosomal protein L19E